MRKILIILSAAVIGLSLGGCAKEPEKEQITEIAFSFWEPGMSHELEYALERVVEGYEEIHPEIKIKLISEPVESYQDWIKSCVAADDLPDIESNHANNLIEQYNAGLIVNISDKLGAPSAYSDVKRWSETFIKEQMHNRRGISIPFFGTELGIYYNKNIYSELGLSVPHTWREFLDNCEVIADTGKLPIAFIAQKEDACQWLSWDVAGGLFAGEHLNDKNININGDNSISTYEAHRAILTGYVNFENDAKYRSEFTEYVKRLCEFLQYCGGYSGLEETVAKSMFLSGEAAHIHTGSWDIAGLMKNSECEFEVGIFNFPLFTEEETPYGGVHIKHLSAQHLAVTTSAYSEEGKLEKVVDFLQYLTSNEVYAKFIADTAQIPVVNGIEYAEGAEVFKYDGYSHDQLLIQRGNCEMLRSILEGNIPKLDNEFFADLQKSAMAAAKAYAADEKLSAENGYYMEEEKSKGIFGK